MKTVTVTLKEKKRLALVIDDLTLEVLVRRTHDLTDAEQEIEPGGAAVCLRDVRDIHILRVVKMCDGDYAMAARKLGLGRTTLYRYRKSRRFARLLGTVVGTSNPLELSRPCSVSPVLEERECVLSGTFGN